jgi:hypothetical protein
MPGMRMSETTTSKVLCLEASEGPPARSVTNSMSHFVAGAAEHALQALQHERLVVDEQDARLHAGSGGRRVGERQADEEGGALAQFGIELDGAPDACRRRRSER